MGRYPAVQGSNGFATSHFDRWGKTPVQSDRWREDELAQLAHKPVVVSVHDHSAVHAERISIPLPWDVGGWMLLAVCLGYHAHRDFWLPAVK
jgi:hypothetical protein